MFPKCFIANCAQGEMSNEALSFFQPGRNFSEALCKLQEQQLSVLQLKNHVGVGGQGGVTFLLQNIYGCLCGETSRSFKK